MLKRFFMALCTMLLVSASQAQILTYGSSQAGYGFKIYHVESALYPYVHVYLRTFDANKLPLVNLNQANVGLLIKGRTANSEEFPYKIESMSARPEGARTVFVIDTSGTMAGEPFESSLEAVARFIDIKRDQDQVAIIALADNKQGYTLVSGFETDPVRIANRLADLTANGKVSRLYDAVGAALQLGAAAYGVSNASGSSYINSTSIIVISDGADAGSAMTRSELNTRVSNLRIPIPIHAVSYSTVSPQFLRNLQSLANNSFGKFYELGEAYNQMTQTLEEIQSVVLGDYVLTFRSNLPVDGELHRFKLGIEYPANSQIISYDSAEFEAIELPRFPQVEEWLSKLDKKFDRVEPKAE